ncbi:sigma 54 modulation/S30EA ribosomal C-terminal domain-containing protein, partial [Alphaproteobacteria bacterium]|nr:sigma 54 modulation/S30EA ribosomal C-terminal domain-containing protein [Alphaproteobacteria bacterium]
QVSEAEEAKSDEELVPVFADMSYDIETLSVDQAVMRLELSGANMLMFRNANHLGLNVVHFREDGTIGWIDPRGMRRMAGGV